MKKIVSVLLCIFICMAFLVGCSSTVVPISAAKWIDGEHLVYAVRRASDYELAYIGMYDMQKIDDQYTFLNSFAQQIPSEAIGTYATDATFGEQENTWELSESLSVREVYAKSDFTDTELYQKAVTAANGNQSDFVYMEGEDIVVDMSVQSTSVVISAGLLPVSTSKTVKSVFVGCGVFEINDITTTVTYDYSDKKPVATCKTNVSGQEVSSTKKLGSGKTYDNEQLSFLIRSFSLDTLVSNASTALTVFDGTGLQDTTNVTLGVTASNYQIDYKVGGVWKTIDSDKNILYYKSGDAYTDAKGNVIEVMDRKVALVYAQTSGLPMFFYLDDQDRTTAGDNYRSTIIRMQQSYLVFDLKLDYLSTL